MKVIHKHSGGCGGLYFLGFIGALVYFIQQATSFTDGLVGLLKAFIWPAFLIHAAFELLKL